MNNIAKKTAYLSLAVLAMCFSNCSDDDLGGGGLEMKDMITVQLPGSGTRTSISDDGETSQVLWSEDDVIGIISTKSGADNYHVKSVISSGAGTSGGTFNAASKEGYTRVVAYYPYNESVTYADKALSLTMPTKYEYDAKNPKSSNKAPMAALFGSSSNSIGFKNAGALIHVTLKDAQKNLTAVTLTSAGESPAKLAGKATISFDANSVPTLSINISNEADGTSITITVPENTAAGTKDFYFPVPAGEYSSLKLTATIDGKTCELETKSSEKIERGMCYSATYALDPVTGEIPAEVKSAAEASSKLKEVNAVSIADMSSSQSGSGGDAMTITIPAKAATETFETETASDGNTTVTNTRAASPVTSISFKSTSGASTDKPIKLVAAENTETNKAVAEQVIVSIPVDNAQGGTSEAKPTFEIELPTSTVTLSSNGSSSSSSDGSATSTYEKVTASTAESTLIVDAGVVIKELIVKKGNVRVKKGGKIEKITNSVEGGSNITLYVESGVDKTKDIPSSLSNITVADADLADLKNAAAKGGVYTMTSDITLTEPLVVAAQMVLDLNGHSLKASESGLKNVLDTHDAVVLVRRGAKLFINDSGNGKGSINANGVKSIYAAVKLTDSNDEKDETIKGKAAELIVNGGQLIGVQTEVDRYAICGQGTRHGTNITINGGIITGSTGIYHPQNGTLTVTGGSITGKQESGIELRSGTLNITGGTIISEGTFSAKANGSGTTIKGAALAVSQHTTDYAIDVTISGGTFTGPYSLYEADLQNKTGSKISGISGGTFNGKIYSENCTNFVTGGTFSDPNVLSYLGEKANVNVKLSGDAEMANNIILGKGKAVTMDLNGKTLTISSTTTSVIDGTAYIKNGSMKTAKQLYVRENGDLTLDKVALTETSHTAIWAQGPNVKLTVKNSSSVTGKYFGISTNASVSEGKLTYGENATIVLENSTFNSEETGFMNNVPANVTITNCQFSGNHQGALLRGGEYTITNSTFTLKASLDKDTYNEGEWTAKSGTWSVGNRCAFAAITIGNKDSGAYKYYTTVDMKSVTAKVEGDYKDDYSAIYVAANKAENLGVTWTYDSKCVFGDSGQSSVKIANTGNITVNGASATATEE